MLASSGGQGYGTGLIPVERSIQGCSACGNSAPAASRSPPWAMGRIPSPRLLASAHRASVALPSTSLDPLREPMTWTTVFHPPDTLVVLGLALAIEAAAGYPDRLYRALGHPVTWIGWVIARLDRSLNTGQRGETARGRNRRSSHPPGDCRGDIDRGDGAGRRVRVTCLPWSCSASSARPCRRSAASTIMSAVSLRRSAPRGWLAGGAKSR